MGQCELAAIIHGGSLPGGTEAAEVPSRTENWRCSDASAPNQEGASQMRATSTVLVVVESDGNQDAAHANLHALGSFADRLGLGTMILAR